MNKIPQEIIDRILDAASIVDVIGEDVTLHKNGVNYIALCPFHNEKTPSFVVSPSKGICKCFSCGKGGNVIWYVMEHDGITFPEAVRQLGKRYGIDVPSIELTPEQAAVQDKRASAMAVMAAAQDLFRQNMAAPAAKEYMAERRISDEIASVYGVGFAYDYDGLTRALTAQGYAAEHIIAAGLGYMDQERCRLKDQFWQRILFPFYSKTGQIIGYTGRAVNEQKPKYKNTAETLLFTKGRNIYGLYQARAEIARQDCVYIVEGQFDVLSMAQHGIRNVVGGSGTAFTDEQRKLLHGITNNVIFIYDGDTAGINAAGKQILAFVRDQFKVRCVLLPAGKDPDDMAKQLGDGFGDYLKRATKSYVDFMAKVLFSADDDEYKRADKVRQILGIVVHERELVVRDKFLSALCEPSGYDLQQLTSMLDETKQPQLPDRFEPGFFGVDFAQDYIDPEESELHLVGDFKRFQKLIGEKQPYIFFNGAPTTNDIQQIAKLADRFVVHSPDMTDCSPKRETPDCLMMKALFKYGLTVDVSDDGDVYGFIYYYVRFYGDLIREDKNSPEAVNEYVTRCAEMISYAKQSIQTVNMNRWAEELNIKLVSLKELVKPFANERKSQQKMNKERSDVYDDLIAVDTDRIPEYVENSEEYSKMLRRYGFYPLLNKEGTPVSYMFRSDNNFRRVADFYIEPLFHVYSPNKEENRRVIKINRLYVNKPTYVEWPSSVFVKLTSLQEMLINEGAYNFEGGDAKDYQKIWNCISYNFPKCLELKVYGQQPEDCFVFANGIYHQVDGGWKFEYSDELGLMKHEDAIFYSPSFSKINAAVRQDNDRYEQDRWLCYTDTPTSKRITFEHWASLMNEVYKINDNGKWALLYSIMSAFRSDIFPIGRIFTSVFFIGPTMSGKTQIAISIRSLYIKPEAPSFNLNSGTDAAFFSILEKFRDVPQVFEEYNDDMISDYKFQGLKSVTYDGEGKQKRKSATSIDVESSKVNAPAVLLGQEAPQKDDNALTNRVVLCEVPKRDSINEDHAQQIFQELKEAERAGLSYILLEVLALRPLVKQHFQTLLRQVSRELQDRVEMSSSRSGDQTRVINTVSLFLTMCKLMEAYAPHLKLPFTYNEMLGIAVAKVRWQVDMLVKTDKLTTFFAAIDYLIDKGSIKIGRDYKIERPARLKLKGGIERVLPTPDTAVLYMNLSNIHKMYQASMSNGDKPLSMTTLDVNLNSHPSYIGQVSNTRFRWMEVKEVPAGGMVVDKETGQTTTNMIMTRVMEPREKQTSTVVINYDILSSMLGIDFERTERPDNAAEPQQGDLPF